MDVDENGRLGHSSPRGGIHWEDQTYSDRSVLLAAPQSFDPARGGVIIVFFHGNNATLSRDVIARQQIVRQLSDSGLNAVLVAPQLAVDAQDSSAGRFWSSGGFSSFLGEAQSKLGDLYPNARGAFRRMPIVIVAYSGGYLPAAYSLAVGGDSGSGARAGAARRALRRARQIRELGGGAGTQRLLRQRLFDVITCGQRRHPRRARGRRRADRERPAGRSSPPASSRSSTRALSITTTSSPRPGAARPYATSSPALAGSAAVNRRRQDAS